MTLPHLVLAVLLGQAPSASRPPTAEFSCAPSPAIPEDVDGLVEALRTAPTSLETHATSPPCSFPEEDRAGAIYRQLSSLGPAAIPALTRALRDPDVRLRRNAVWLLDMNGFIGSRPPAGWTRMDIKWAVPILIDLLADEDEYVRLRAVECFALSDIGHDGGAALSALQQMRENSPEGSIPRRLVEAAIQKITP